MSKSYVMLGDGPVPLSANHDGECFTVESQEEVRILGEDGSEDSPLQHFLRVRTSAGTEGWLRAVDVDQATPLRTPKTALSPANLHPPRSVPVGEHICLFKIAAALESQSGMALGLLQLARELKVSKRDLEGAITPQPLVYEVKQRSNTNTQPLDIHASDGHTVAVRLGTDGSSLFVGEWVCSRLRYVSSRDRLEVELDLGECRSIVLPHMPSARAALLSRVLCLADAAGVLTEGFPDVIRARIEVERSTGRVTLVTGL